MSRSVISDAAPWSTLPPFRVQSKVADYFGESGVRCFVLIVALRSSTHRRLWWDWQMWYAWIPVVAVSQQGLLAGHLPGSWLLMTLILSLKNGGGALHRQMTDALGACQIAVQQWRMIMLRLQHFLPWSLKWIFFVLNVLLCYSHGLFEYAAVNCTSRLPPPDSFPRRRRVCLLILLSNLLVEQRYLAQMWKAPLKVSTVQFSVRPFAKSDMVRSTT